MIYIDIYYGSMDILTVDMSPFDDWWPQWHQAGAG